MRKSTTATLLTLLALLASLPLAPQPADADGRTAAQPSRFARDVTTHVVLHEVGHALVREFDLPVLGNEETLADAFATHYLTTHLPDRAVDVLCARVQSLMIEAREERDGADSAGEHNGDGRRAFQIAALAVAADAEKYRKVADIAGLSEAQIAKARDYGSEIHRSWRRILQPLWMPTGQLSNEARVRVEPNDRFLERLCTDEWLAELRHVVRRFDWHSQVTVQLVQGDGGAGWSRKARTVTVNTAYVRRFVEQGETAKRSGR